MSVRRFLQHLSSGLAAVGRTCVLSALVLGQAGQAVLAQPLEPVAFDELDVDPPLIRHEVVPEAPAAFRQLFNAEVTDDRALASVTLFWRFEGEDRYQPVEMTAVPDSPAWSARVPTSDLESRAIEYYLQARDTGGNRTVRGFAFSPLVRTIRSDRPLATPVESAPATVARSRVIYYVLGALTIGLVAGFVSSGGDGDDGGEPSECGDDGCEVVITFQSPVVQ